MEHKHIQSKLHEMKERLDNNSIPKKNTVCGKSEIKLHPHAIK